MRSVPEYAKALQLDNVKHAEVLAEQYGVTLHRLPDGSLKVDGDRVGSFMRHWLMIIQLPIGERYKVQ